MKDFDSIRLDSTYIQKIHDFIEKKRTEISSVCVNGLIRDDIFPLLDKYCTVIYYPTEDKENNGFHTNFYEQGEEKHFVYINTAQHEEKQIFTAAHELGHIWKVDEFVSPSCDDETKEKIINRFASELLMPQEYFSNFVKKEFEKYLNRDEEITVIDTIKVITATMNYFFTSYKSVVYRFYETNHFNEDSCNILWGENVEAHKAILTLSEKLAKENGYNRLYKTDKRKWINGLKELLDIAAESRLFSNAKLESFYSDFELQCKSTEKALTDTLPINIEEADLSAN